MIFLYTDFGACGPYMGQVKARLLEAAPLVPAIDLFADAPAFHIQESAYLLAAHALGLPVGSVFLCVVDPGVGGVRPTAVIRADGRWFVGPGNGLFEIVARRAGMLECFAAPPVKWLVAPTFHGRDVFAPIAARLALSGEEGLNPIPEIPRFPDWPDDLASIVYCDHYGNLMTGMRASSLPPSARIGFCGHVLKKARIYEDVSEGEAFWYENSNGLAEIAVRRQSAKIRFGTGIGAPVTLL